MDSLSRAKALTYVMKIERFLFHAAGRAGASKVEITVGSGQYHPLSQVVLTYFEANRGEAKT